MSWESYSAFIVTAFILIVVPGPVVVLMIATGITRGRVYGLVTVAGTALAMGLHLIITVLGATWVLVVFSNWFEWLRWAGVAYLLFLGIQYWRQKSEQGEGQTLTSDSGRLGDEGHLGRAFTQGFLVAVANPKTILFYAVFFPQFVNESAPLLPQMSLMAISFFILALFLDTSWLLCASKMQPLLRRSVRLRQRLAGTFLIGAGLGLALVKRT